MHAGGLRGGIDLAIGAGRERGRAPGFPSLAARSHSDVDSGGERRIIPLMGLVTKNAILLVDGALQHVREGDPRDVAVCKAGPRRLRPILMTSGAMVLGMLPIRLPPRRRS